jgi:hypothetical protein
VAARPWTFDGSDRANLAKASRRRFFKECDRQCWSRILTWGARSPDNWLLVETFLKLCAPNGPPGARSFGRTLQTNHNDPQPSDPSGLSPPRLWLRKSRVRTPSSTPSSDYGLRTTDYGLRTRSSDYGLQSAPWADRQVLLSRIRDSSARRRDVVRNLRPATIAFAQPLHAPVPRVSARPI